MVARRSLEVDSTRLLKRPQNIYLNIDYTGRKFTRVMSGINEYIQLNNLDWNVVYGHHISYKANDILDWFDGIIFDHEHTDYCEQIAQARLPSVSIAQSRPLHAKSDFGLSVCIDNKILVNSAVQLLQATDVASIGLLSSGQNRATGLYNERLDAYNDAAFRESFQPQHYEYRSLNFNAWVDENHRLKLWLELLKKPCGLIVSDMYVASSIKQICLKNSVLIPEEVRIVVIDSTLTQELAESFGFTSLVLNYHKVGFRSAEFIHQALTGDEGRDANGVELIESSMFRGDSTSHTSILDDDVLKAFYVIKHNYMKGIKVQQVIDYCGCSRTLLETKFKEHVGHSIHTELHRIRFDKAKDLLVTTELNVTQICELVGYPSSHYLFSLFSKEEGLTPKKYRELNWRM